MSADLFLPKLYEWLGARAILLPLPLGKKRPELPGWQAITFERTQEPDYQSTLKAAADRRGNIGVLLADRLAAIDIDNDSFIEEFLALNPALTETLRSRGARGCQLWMRMIGDYPEKIIKLKKADGSTFGEWRGGGGAQSVIAGQHPNGMRYARTVGKPVVEIAFGAIVWPVDVVLPWKQTAPMPGNPPLPASNGSHDANLHKRISAYIAAIPGAISGNDGHGQTYYAACALWNGWALSIDEAMPYLQLYNQRCEPPWTDKELAHKLESAEKDSRHEKPRGHLRDAIRPAQSGNNHGQPPAAPNDSQTTGVRNGKPVLLLPCPSVEIEQCARECFPILSKSHRYFTRDRTVFEVVRNGESIRLGELDPAAFRSQLESFFWLGTLRTMLDGKPAIIQNRCSVDNAVALLKADPTFEILPRVKIVTAAAVFTETDGQVHVLGKGYYDICGGILVTRAHSIANIEVHLATEAILSLLDDFDFLSEADRSRAVASFISPALRLGGLLPFDFPLDLSEANESQSGKTYRQKVVCALYGEKPFVLNKNEELGVGSLDERLSEGLISGQPFLMLENIRGPIKSQLLESAIRGVGWVQARRAYSRPVQVETDSYCWMLSSNKAETTPDLANRSIITGIRKQPDSYSFKVYPEGDLLQHVKLNSNHYLACILSILRFWHEHGKGRTTDARHDFREWCQTLDWIVQNIFNCPPLLDGHRSEQQRISNPDLNWLRQVGLCAEKDKRLGEGLKPAEITELCESHGLDIPGARPQTDDSQRSMLVGRILKRLFTETQTLEIGGYRIERNEGTEYNTARQQNMFVQRLTFGRLTP